MLSTKPIPPQAVKMVGFSLLQPAGAAMAYQPDGFNAWESQLWYQASRRSGISQWLFNRFGTSTDSSIPVSARLREADYRAGLRAMEQACTQAFASLDRQQMQRIRHERTALVYFDCWGESALFEAGVSWRDALSLDLLPASIVRDYNLKDFSCKVQGEHQGFLLALRVAIDQLNSGSIDTVLLCGLYRSLPLMVFSQHSAASVRAAKGTTHTSVERSAALILRKTADEGVALHLNDYFLLPAQPTLAAQQLAQRWQQYWTPECCAMLGAIHTSAAMLSLEQAALKIKPLPWHALTTIYGDSGCINPLLALLHLSSVRIPANHPSPQLLVNALDGNGAGWLMSIWPDARRDRWEKSLWR